MNTIADKLQNIVDAKSAISAAIIDKGGTVPTKFSEYGNAIEAIPTPEPTLWGAPISALFDPVTGKKFPEPVSLSIDISSPDGYYGLHYQWGFSSQEAGRKPNYNLKSVTFPKLEKIKTSNGQRPFYYSFAYNAGLSSVSFPVLSSIGYETGDADGTQAYTFMYTFSGCSSLTSVTFPELVRARGTSVFDAMFNVCPNLKRASFPKLETVHGNGIFNGFVGGSGSTLSALDFPVLSSIRGAQSSFKALAGSSTTLKTLTFPKVEYIQGATSTNYATFYGNVGLTDIYLPKWDTIAGGINIFNNCTALTAIHCGAENKTAVEAMAGYSTKWGAPNTDCQVLFDL